MCKASCFEDLDSYLSAHYVPDCGDAKGWACKVAVLVFHGMAYAPSILHHIMHFVSPGGLQGREDSPVPYLCFFLSLSETGKKNAQILTFHCILENVLPVARSISWRKLKLLTFCIVQSRCCCCCWQKPSQAASAKRCRSSGTENALSEASETQGLGEFLK